METPVICKVLTFALMFNLHMSLASAFAISVTDELVKLGMVQRASNNICPEITCGSTYMNIILKKSELHEIDLANIHLIDPTCLGFENSVSTILVQSKVEDKYCGTQLIVNKTHAIYKNRVTLPPHPSLVIIRETYVIDAACAYPLDMNVSLENALNPIISTIVIILAGIGNFEVKMALFRDPAYSIPRDEEDVLSTKDNLYVGVLITKGDTTRFNLVLKSCFATAIPNFYGALKYYIIKDSCKNENDKTIHIAANGIASFAQFSIQAFKFLGGYNQIYLHCEVHLCDNKLGSCIPVCPAVTGSSGSPDPDSTISLGTIPIKDPSKLCPHLQCGATYINVTFNKNDLKDSNMDINDLHVNKKNCHDLYDSESSVTVGWPLGDGICGTTLITNATHAIYENAIYLAQNPSQIIYREEYILNVSCTYPLDMNVSLDNVLNPILSIIHLFIEGTGAFEVIMAAFTDRSYLTPYKQGELMLSTKDRLYVGVFISKGDIRQFYIVLQKCYATPTNNANDLTQYSIIQDSCPNKADGTVEVHAKGISSQSQFSFQIFKFINHNYVYLHCQIHLCSKSGACLPICPKFKTRSANPVDGTITFGPIQRIESTEATTATTTTTTPTTTTTTTTTPTTTTTTTTTPTTTDTTTTTLTTNPTTTTVPTTTPKKIDATTGSAEKRTSLDALTILALLLCWRFY